MKDLNLHEPGEFITPDEIQSMIDRTLVHARTYEGIVKLIVDPVLGIVKVSIPKQGSFDQDQNSWFTALPGNRFYSAITPQVGDTVEIYYPNWDPDRIQYRVLDQRFYDSPNAGPGKFVVFEFNDFRIVYDTLTNEAEIRNGDAVIVLKTEGRIEFNDDDIAMHGSGDIEQIGDLDSDGEVTAKAASPSTSVGLSTHIHQGPAGPTAPPDGGS